MATTTNYAWDTPDDTDLVKDGAAAIRTLGSSIDSTVFTNAGAAIAKTIVDAKGDIIAATAADTVARVAVGANNTVLTADSTQPSGVKWATASAGAAGVYTSKLSGGTNYIKSGNTTAFASVTANQNMTYYTPIIVSTITADRILCTTAPTYAGTSTVRLGIYNNDATLNSPSTLLLDAGTVTPTASSTSYEITISQALTGGLYWLAFNMQAVATNDVFAGNGGSAASYSPIGMANDTSASLLLGTSFLNAYRQSGVTGAFANAGTMTRSSGTNVVVGLRY